MKMFQKLVFTMTLLSSFSVMAGWKTLGPISDKTLIPDLVNCKVRFVSTFSNPNIIVYPISHSKYAPDNIRFKIPMALGDMAWFTYTPRNVFKNAAAFFNTATSPKDIYVSISIGAFASVSVNVDYADANYLVQGRGYGIETTELSKILLQQECSASI